MSAARSLRTRLLLLFGGTVFALALAEVACRIDALFPKQRYDAGKARDYFSARAENNAERELEAFAAPDPNETDSSLRPVPHPYLGWTDERSTRQIEEASRWYATAESEQTFDILLLGGSVAAQFGNSGHETLEHVLNADPRFAGRRVRVWNHGHAGYKAPQTSNLAAWLFELGQKPDAVILLDGFNEVAVARSNSSAGAHPLYPFLEYWGTLARGRGVDVAALDLMVEMRVAQKKEAQIASSALALGLHHSALLTRITLARLASRRKEFEAARTKYAAYLAAKSDDIAVRGVAFDADPERACDLAVQGWFENSRALQAICAAHGVPCLHVLQPTLHDAGSKPLTSEEMHDAGASSAWLEGVRCGYPRMRAAGTRLAAAGLSFFDATGVFHDQTERIYIDVCHVNYRGSVLLGRAIGAELLRRVH
jgi:hypothetical protein